MQTRRKKKRLKLRSNPKRQNDGIIFVASRN